MFSNFLQIDIKQTFDKILPNHYFLAIKFVWQMKSNSFLSMHIIRKHRSGRAVGAMAIDVKTIQHQETTPRIKHIQPQGDCIP